MEEIGSHMPPTYKSETDNWYIYYSKGWKIGFMEENFDPTKAEHPVTWQSYQDIPFGDDWICTYDSGNDTKKIIVKNIGMLWFFILVELKELKVLGMLLSEVGLKNLKY